MNLRSEIADLDREIKNLEELYREATAEWQQKDVIAVAAQKDAEEAYQRKKELWWDIELRKAYQLKLIREVGKHEMGA